MNQDSNSYKNKFSIENHLKQINLSQKKKKES